jgi:hypothetical protein
MVPIDPVSLQYLTQTVHQDRLRDLEKQWLVRQALASQPKVFAPFLTGLGRRLMALGQKLQQQSPALPERQHTSL